MGKLIASGWVEQDGIPTIAQVDAIKSTKSSSSGAEVQQTLSKAGKPLTLQPGKKIALKLAERTQLSRCVVLYSFALPSDDHVLGLPVGQHVYLSTKMANPRTGGDLQYVARAYTPISTDGQKGRVEL